IKQLFMKGARVSENETETNDSLLQLAYKWSGIHSQSHIFQVLMEMGCKINAPPSIETSGKTVLQMAVSRAVSSASRSEYYSDIMSLIRLGADVNGPPAFSGGRTALQLAAENRSGRYCALIVFAIS